MKCLRIRPRKLKGEIYMNGIGTSKGISIGKAYIYSPLEIQIIKKIIKDSKSEINKLDKGIQKAIAELDKLYEKSIEIIGEDDSKIFIAHKMILEDPEFIKATNNMITAEEVCCEWAVDQVFRSFISLFSNIEDEYIRARALDIKDVSSRLIRILMNVKDINLSNIDEKSIIVAKELTPSDTFQINRDMIEGFVTELGGKTSHTAIIARTMNIPAISGVKGILNQVKDGDILIIDGTTGNVIVNPTPEELEEFENKKKKLHQQDIELSSLKGKENITRDGHIVGLMANIGSLKDIDLVIENDGDGVGLFRTEFLFMDREQMPSEEEQFEVYKKVASSLDKKPLVIRTMDVGGDKVIPYLNLPKEMNPFLGYRAIRISLDRRDIFETQLRAIIRASYYGNIKIMFPMISSVVEVREVKKIIDKIKKDLKKENIPFNEDIEIGIMVEIPAVAIQSRAFAREVDFFSIGTNDLIQYTLAVDRGNQDVAYIYDQYNPAVLNLINITIKNGHKEGIKVGMCGEAAADEYLVPIFLAMGLDEFSMTSSSILRTRNIIRHTSKKEIESLLDYILTLDSSEDIKKYIEDNIII